ncbi:MAG: hypothetical protein WCA38_12435 [Candidatus Acidiferrales bacterium]
MRWRIWLLLGVVAAIATTVFLFPAIPQSEAYHHFADTRAFGGVPNAFDVMSNALFLVVGLLGMRFVLRPPGGSSASGYCAVRVFGGLAAAVALFRHATREGQI